MWEGVINWSQGETEYREEIILLGDNSENNCNSVVLITCKAYLFWEKRFGNFQNLRLLSIPKIFIFLIIFTFLTNTPYFLCKHLVSTHRENQSIPEFLVPEGKTVVTFFMCVSLRGGLIESSVQLHEGQKLQLACNCFLFQLQNSLGITDVLLELRSNLSLRETWRSPCAPANRRRFVPCTSSSQHIWILDQDRIPCPAPRLGHVVEPHCSITSCKLCPWWCLPARAAWSPHPSPHLCSSHWHLFILYSQDGA